MATGWKNVHVFVSSTFNDMHAERDHLVKRVFPQLREWCEQRKLRLVDIDLRWGVTEEDATRNRNVVRTCLERIDQCRPFFVCFLGQRRGWVPEPKHIVPDVFTAFPEVARYVGRASVTEMEILHALIEPFHGGNRYAVGKEEEFYRRVEHAFFYLRDSSYLTQLPPVLRRTYTNEGSDNPVVDDAELARWRDDVIPSAAKQWNRPLHTYQATWLPEAVTPELGVPLECPSADPGNQLRWREQWRDAGVHMADDALEVPLGEEPKARAFNQHLTSGRLADFTTETGEELADTLLRELQDAIAQRHPSHVPVEQEDPLQREIDQHEEFLHINSEGFIERAGDFDALDAYLADESGQMFVLTAPGGMGKSMLLANWVERSRSEMRYADTAFVSRFVGQSDGSSTVGGLLRFVMLELQKIHGRIPETKMETVKDPDGQERSREVPLEIPQDPVQIHNTWREQLEHLGESGKTVVVIDALNQLESGLSNLCWLPFSGLPKNVKVIASFREGAPGSEECMQRWPVNPNIRMERVKPFEDLDDRRNLVKAYLRQFLKELDDDHLETLIRSDGAGNPLFLKVVLSELRVLGAFAQLGDTIRTQFGTTPVSAFDAILRRLESDPAYSAMDPAQAVPLVFGLLAHARRGLSADELACLLMARGENENAARDTVHLFFRQVRPFLARRNGRYDFFYESFKAAVTERYVKEPEGPESMVRPAQAWHGLIADYFHTQPDFTHCTVADRKRHPHMHRCEELAWQLVQAGDWSRLKDLLMSLEFLEAKVVAGMAFELPVDFTEALRIVPAEEPERKILALLDEAVRRDIYFIARHADDYPQAVFQCLWNSGWWYDCPDAAQHYEEPEDGWKTPPPWNASAPKLHEHMERARAIREGGNPGFAWVRSLRPPRLHLGTAQKAVFRGHTDAVSSVAFSPDGTRIVSGSNDYTLRIWDAFSGACINILRGHMSIVTSVAISSDNTHIVSGSWDSTVRVWDSLSGRCANTLRGHTSWVTCVAFSPGGTRIVSGSSDNTLRIWDALSGACINILQGHTDLVSSVAFSPDGACIVSGSHDHTLCVWDAHSGACTNVFRGHTNGVECAVYSPDGTRIVSGSRDNTLCVWDAASGKCVSVYRGHTGPVTSVAFSSDGVRIVSGSDDTSLRVWDARNGTCVHALQGHVDEVLSVAFSLDGMHIASGSFDNTLRVWDGRSGTCINTLRGHSGSVTEVAFSPDGERIVSGASDLRIWDAHSGVCLHALERHSNMTPGVTFSPDGTRFATSSLDYTLRVWDVASAACVCTLAHKGRVSEVAFSPDSTCIVSGWDDLRVWDVRSGACSSTLQGHTKHVSTVAFSPDGRRIVSGSDDMTLRIWDARSGTCINTLRGHSGSVTKVAFSPDGERVVSGSTDQTLRVWDAISGVCINTLRGHSGSVTDAAFSSDGIRIVSACNNNTIRIWDAFSGTCLEVVQGPSDVAAIAAGPKVHPFRARVHGGVIVVEDAASGGVNAWFPEGLCPFFYYAEAIIAHPAESLWAGSDRNYLYLVRLEGGRSAECRMQEEA